jgi:hypothetical protein
MKLSLTTQLKLVPLEMRRDKKNFIVEDLVSGEFYEMPEVCIDAIKMIQHHTSLEEIEIQLKQKYPMEEVDLLDFSKQLLELELIEEIDGRKVQSNSKGQRVHGFNWVSPKLGRYCFNKFTMILYPVLFIVDLTLVTVHPHLLPEYKDLFMFDLMVLNIPAWMFLTLVSVLIHEFGHILAIRSYNLPAKLEIGHRFFLVVFETDLSSAWKLRAKDRNQLYVAGLCFDTIVLFLALIGQLANMPFVFHAVFRFIVLDTFIRMIYQLCVYMKTDLYYVIENSTGCYNLMENAQAFLRELFKLQPKGTEAGEAVFNSEKKKILCYSVFYLTGVVVMMTLFAVFYIPQFIFALQKVLPEIQGPTTKPAFWDSVVLVLQLLIWIFLLGYSWSKKYRKVN